jgi:hypothetical protein
MMGGIRKKVTMEPLSSPNPQPISRTSATAMEEGMPFVCMNPATRTAVSETAEPTERSMPPLTITMVTPTPAIPTMATCFSRLVKLDTVKKYLLNRESTIAIAMSAARAPISGVSLNRPRGLAPAVCIDVLTLSSPPLHAEATR